MITLLNQNSEVVARGTVTKISTDLAVETFKELGYELTLGEKNGKPTARAIKIHTKAKFPKPIFNYFFPSEDRLFLFLLDKYNELMKYKQEDEHREALKKEASKNFVNPYLVNDIYYTSYGYEQTNIDFYQVVAVKGRKVTFREIAAIKVEDVSWDSEMVKPDMDHFIGEPFDRIVRIHIDSNGKAVGKINIDDVRGWPYKYDKGEKGCYQSHSH